MANYIPISAYIEIGNVSCYLAANDESNMKALKGGAYNTGLSKLIHAVTHTLNWAYSVNPNDPNLNTVALYLYALCGKYVQMATTIINNQSAVAPVLSGPNNQTATVGGAATFSVTVTSALAVSYQWLLNGTPISGATNSTYIVSNAQLSQSGSTYSVSVTNSAGTTTSTPATLTVTASITGFFYYNAADPGPTLMGNSDPFTYQVSYSIMHNSPISITMPSASSPNMFLVAKVPSTESSKTTWYNDSFNSGTIVPPDSVFQSPVTFGGFTYYFTRISASLDISQPLILT